jgi:hypothetical protein
LDERGDSSSEKKDSEGGKENWNERTWRKIRILLTFRSQELTFFQNFQELTFCPADEVKESILQ